MVTVIDMISRNRDGIEIPKIERLVGNNKKVSHALQDLMVGGIIEQDGDKILPGSNLDKALICLEILRSLLALIERESEERRRKKVTIDLGSVDLNDIDLSGHDLRGINLSGRDISNSNLSRSNLSGADLSDADLRRANLSGADLDGANLSDAHIS